MNQQENEDLKDIQQRSDEDLPLNEERAEAVKGGAEIKHIKFKPGKDLDALG